MLRIAGIQFVGHVDREVNVRNAIRLVRDAAVRGAKIVCLSELFSTIYFCVEPRQEYFDWAEPIPGPTIDRMAEVARETGTVLIAPIFERASDGRFYNAAPVIDPDGHVIGKYRKSSIPFMDRAAPSRAATRSPTSSPATSASRRFPPPSAASAFSSAMTATSPKPLACSVSTERRSSSSCPPPRPV